MARWLALLLLCLGSQAAPASSTDYCGNTGRVDVAALDQLLQLAARLESQLDASGADVALVARAGLDLSRFGLRYSHAGIALRGPAGWQVRQLYYDCEGGAARIFDQGLPGFVLGNAQADPAFVSALILHGEPAARLAAQARNDASALSLLGTDYSANAYAFATRFQNCNQWVAELMAQAWGQLPDAPPGQAHRAREAAQSWLQQAGYQPSRISSHNPFVIIGSWFIPFLHRSDHPPEARASNQFLVSMPASLEAFASRQVANSHRLELCLRDGRILMRQGPISMDEHCTPGPQDQQWPLAAPGVKNHTLPAPPF